MAGSQSVSKCGIVSHSVYLRISGGFLQLASPEYIHLQRFNADSIRDVVLKT